MRVTRRQVRNAEPPPLTRQTALRRVNFSKAGKRAARQLSLDDNSEYSYFQLRTLSNGNEAITHVFMNRWQELRIPHTHRNMIPEFVFVSV